MLVSVHKPTCTCPGSLPHKPGHVSLPHGLCQVRFFIDGLDWVELVNEIYVLNTDKGNVSTQWDKVSCCGSCLSWVLLVRPPSQLRFTQSCTRMYL